MVGLNKAKAQAVLADLPLSASSRRFADFWLSAISVHGSVWDKDLAADLLANTVSFEISPHNVRIRSAGRRIIDAFGAPLVGEDYLQMAPPAQRPIRLARMCSVVEGHISTHQRWVVNQAGKIHILNELALPCGLSERGLPMIMAYVDTDSPSSVGRIVAHERAMNVAPVFAAYPIH
jgi:hypothetical protein